MILHLFLFKETQPFEDSCGEVIHHNFPPLPKANNKDDAAIYRHSTTILHLRGHSLVFK